MTRIDEPSRFYEKTWRPLVEVLGWIGAGFVMAYITIEVMDHFGILQAIFEQPLIP